MSRPEHNQREYFRVPQPGVTCFIRIKGKRYEFPILDISIAGLALMLRPETHELIKTGDTHADCTFSIPEHGEIAVTLLIRNVLELNEGSALVFLRAGCSFVGVKPQVQAMLMQYIAHLERENIKRQPYES